MKIRVFEAFAGIGCQREGFEMLQGNFPDDVQFEFIGISEIDAHAVISYNAAHGETPNYGDISKIDWAQVPGFDLFTYSFPCQDISNAGKQAGNGIVPQCVYHLARTLFIPNQPENKPKPQPTQKSLFD